MTRCRRRAAVHAGFRISKNVKNEEETTVIPAVRIGAKCRKRDHWYRKAVAEIFGEEEASSKNNNICMRSSVLAVMDLNISAADKLAHLLLSKEGTAYNSEIGEVLWKKLQNENEYAENKERVLAMFSHVCSAVKKRFKRYKLDQKTLLHQTLSILGMYGFRSSSLAEVEDDVV
jgi:hypothetical protein